VEERFHSTVDTVVGVVTHFQRKRKKSFPSVDYVATEPASASSMRGGSVISAESLLRANQYDLKKGNSLEGWLCIDRQRANDYVMIKIGNDI